MTRSLLAASVLPVSTRSTIASATSSAIITSTLPVSSTNRASTPWPASHRITLFALIFSVGILVDDAIDTAILSPNQVVPVRVPAPERFVLHKLYASQSRRVHPGKSTKDIEQAAVLAAALEEDAADPDALDDFAVEFENQTQNAVGRRMLRTEIDVEVTLAPRGGG